MSIKQDIMNQEKLAGSMSAIRSRVINISISGKDAKVHIQWNLNENSAKLQDSLYRTLDVLVYDFPKQESGPVPNESFRMGDDYTESTIQLESTAKASRFLLECIDNFEGPSSARTSSLAVKFVIPTRDGFCMRSDIIERRLEGYQPISKIQGFLEPRQKIIGLSTDGVHISDQLSTLLSRAAAGIVVNDIEALADLEVELDNRLSFPWICSSPPPVTRIAWVKGRMDLELSKRIWEAARALGITIVILDHHGHWLQDDNPDWAHLREAFIPVDITVNQGFVDRIVNAVRSYNKPIDSIATVSNERLVGVAKACEILKLPTSPSAAYAIASDKYKTREMEADRGGAIRVFSPTELKERLDSKDEPPLQYPLIAKPCMGWGSECIAKVHTETELMAAVQRASDRHRTSGHQRTDVMIEPYIEGPEVDANIVLLDGKIVFYEVCDDFPSAGDAKGNEWDATFQETQMLLPTGLPQNEIEVIRDSLHQSLLRQGFKHGVFHCEGRVRYSSMKYDRQNNVEDLYCMDENWEEQPSFYLHEINARPPGYLETVAVQLTYGVDYYALQLLFAVGDVERYLALTHPFKHGPQWWLVLQMLPEYKSGVMKTQDAAKELLDSFRELKAAVPDYKTLQKGGSILRGLQSSTLNYVAYMSIVSRTSRADALRLADMVRREFCYEVE